MARTKNPTIKRSYTHDSSSEQAPRAGLDVNAIIFSFYDGENKVAEEKFDLAAAFGGALPAPCIGRAAAAFGINTSAGNAGNTVKGEDGEDPNVADRIEAVKDRLATFLEGNWESERESSGPRVTLVVEAIKLALTRAGKSTDDATMQKYIDDIATDPVKKKLQYLENKAVKAAYTHLQIERRNAVLAKLNAEAEASGIGDL